MRPPHRLLLSILIALLLASCGTSAAITGMSTPEPPTKAAEASATPGASDTPTASIGTALPDSTALGGGGDRVQPTPSIIEVAPGYWPTGIGVVVFTRDTLIRDCLALVPWGKWVDPVYSCKKTLLENGSPNLLRPGNFGLAHEIAKDRYGNLWAWFDATGSIAAVICYRGRTHAMFYSGLTANRYDVLDEANKLPAPVPACNAAATH
jgi:hypothetical protein